MLHCSFAKISLEPCQTKIAYFDIKIVIHKNIVRLKIPVYNSKLMHIIKALCNIISHFIPGFNRNLHLFLKMEKIVKGAVHVFKDNDNVRDLGYNTHKQDNIWVAKDALHYYFVLDFVEEFICETRVKDFLNCYCCPIELAFVNHREASLAYLFTHLYFVH